MLKNYPQNKFLSFSEQKQIRIIYKLCLYIENFVVEDEQELQLEHKAFIKLAKYHSYLLMNKREATKVEGAEKLDKLYSHILNQEFQKVKNKRQFEIYLSQLERILGTSSKEYNLSVDRGDKPISPSDPRRKKRSTSALSTRASVLLDGVRSTHNIGAIIRTCECFGIERVYIERPYSDFSAQKLFKTSMGAQSYIDIQFYKGSVSLLESLKRKGLRIISIETSKNARPLSKADFKGQCVFIFGNERYGISESILNMSDEIIQIPLFGVKNSLNVSVSAGIVLSKLREKELV